MPVRRRCTLKIGPGLVRIHRNLEHGLPVHFVPGLCHLIVQIPRMGNPFGNVCCMAAIREAMIPSFTSLASGRRRCSAGVT